jgi:oligopeptide/dipeptide ABC transporter ATP-binding protein
LREVGFAEAEQIYGAYPHQLSGGQRQRAVIAQAIACQPTLIIADEATSKLDSVLGNDILGVLIAMCRRAGSAILLISHDAGVLAAISDRIAVMYAGHIVEEADTSMLFTCPKHPYTQALVQLAAMSFNAGKRRLPVISGEIPDLAEFGAGCCFEPRCDQKLAICASRQPVQIQSGNGRVSCLKYVEHS